jgi:hypothetical protein
MKHAKLQWLENPNQSSVNNLNNIRHDVRRHWEKKEYLKAEIDELKTNSKVKTTETHIGASVTLRRVTSLDLI